MASSGAPVAVLIDIASLCQPLDISKSASNNATISQVFETLRRILVNCALDNEASGEILPRWILRCFDGRAGGVGCTPSELDRRLGRRPNLANDFEPFGESSLAKSQAHVEQLIASFRTIELEKMAKRALAESPSPAESTEQFDKSTEQFDVGFEEISRVLQQTHRALNWNDEFAPKQSAYGANRNNSSTSSTTHKSKGIHQRQTHNAVIILVSASPRRAVNFLRGNENVEPVVAALEAVSNSTPSEPIQSKTSPRNARKHKEYTQHDDTVAKLTSIERRSVRIAMRSIFHNHTTTSSSASFTSSSRRSNGRSHDPPTLLWLDVRGPSASHICAGVHEALVQADSVGGLMNVESLEAGRQLFPIDTLMGSTRTPLIPKRHNATQSPSASPPAIHACVCLKGEQLFTGILTLTTNIPNAKRRVAVSLNITKLVPASTALGENMDSALYENDGKRKRGVVGGSGAGTLTPQSKTTGPELEQFAVFCAALKETGMVAIAETVASTYDSDDDDDDNKKFKADKNLEPSGLVTLIPMTTNALFLRFSSCSFEPDLDVKKEKQIVEAKSKRQVRPRMPWCLPRELVLAGESWKSLTCAQKSFKSSNIFNKSLSLGGGTIMSSSTSFDLNGDRSIKHSFGLETPPASTRGEEGAKHSRVDSFGFGGGSNAICTSLSQTTYQNHDSEAGVTTPVSRTTELLSVRALRELGSCSVDAGIFSAQACGLVARTTDSVPAASFVGLSSTQQQHEEWKEKLSAFERVSTIRRERRAVILKQSKNVSTMNDGDKNNTSGKAIENPGVLGVDGRPSEEEAVSAAYAKALLETRADVARGIVCDAISGISNEKVCKRVIKGLLVDSPALIRSQVFEARRVRALELQVVFRLEYEARTVSDRRDRGKKAVVRPLFAFLQALSFAMCKPGSSLSSSKSESPSTASNVVAQLPKGESNAPSGANNERSFRSFVDVAVVGKFVKVLPRTVSKVYQRFFEEDPPVAVAVAAQTQHDVSKNDEGLDANATTSSSLIVDAAAYTKKLSKRQSSNSIDKKDDNALRPYKHADKAKKYTHNIDIPIPRIDPPEKATAIGKVPGLDQLAAIGRRRGITLVGEGSKRLALNHFTSGFANPSVLFRKAPAALGVRSTPMSSCSGQDSRDSFGTDMSASSTWTSQNRKHRRSLFEEDDDNTNDDYGSRNMNWGKSQSESTNANDKKRRRLASIAATPVQNSDSYHPPMHHNHQLPPVPPPHEAMLKSPRRREQTSSILQTPTKRGYVFSHGTPTRVPGSARRRSVAASPYVVAASPNFVAASPNFVAASPIFVGASPMVDGSPMLMIGSSPIVGVDDSPLVNMNDSPMSMHSRNSVRATPLGIKSHEIRSVMDAYSTGGLSTGGDSGNRGKGTVEAYLDSAAAEDDVRRHANGGRIRVKAAARLRLDDNDGHDQGRR